jgi:butyryl-CoA dehydrogenase
MRQTLDFLLYDWLQAGADRARALCRAFAETFDAVLDTCERSPARALQPPGRHRSRISTASACTCRRPRTTRAAYAESGMLAAAQDYDVGGMQLPCVVEMAGNAFFSKASVAWAATMLTSGNANLLMAHGTPLQREVFAANEFAGRWFGTMCLSEPQAGSSLSDIATRAELEDEADAAGPALPPQGQQDVDLGGEHEMTENIVHLVLAKIPGRTAS